MSDAGVLEFSDSRMEQCVDISLVVDDIVEDEEIFQVFLSANAPRVNLLPQTTNIVITDTSSKMLLATNIVL